MSDRSQHPTFEHLTDYVDGRLAQPEVVELQQHLLICSRCSADVDWLQRTVSTMRSRDEWTSPPALLRSRVIDSFQKRSASLSPIAWLRGLLAPQSQLSAIVPLVALLLVLSAVVIGIDRFDGTETSPGDQAVTTEPVTDEFETPAIPTRPDQSLYTTATATATVEATYTVTESSTPSPPGDDAGADPTATETEERETPTGTYTPTASPTAATPTVEVPGGASPTASATPDSDDDESDDDETETPEPSDTPEPSETPEEDDD